MQKAAALLAALVAGTFCYSTARASVGPQIPSSDLLNDISTAATFADTRLEVGGELGIIVPHQPQTLHQLVIPHLALGPVSAGHTIVYTEFAVGRHGLGPIQPERPNTFSWRAPASTRFAAESSFIRSLVVGQDFFDSFCERFDLQDDDERPWSTTTTVHVLSSTDDWLAPFATLAYEEDSLENNDRIGLGGGLQFRFDRNTTLGGEAIYFADHPNDSLPRETRFLAKFEIDF
ncbi:MAG TPA: hypothetical protein VM008_03755 [Phycisphaerae bacterium]|nr:hypothetical protein [Phycisphaerae bacterium]